MTTTLALLSSTRGFDLNDPSSLVLDLDNPKPKEVLAIVELFEADMKSKPELGKLPVKTGWNDITPKIGIQLMRRNRPGANRRIDPGTVLYYANQMRRDQWKKTGQPILFSEKDKMLDAQHRVLAGIIAGVTFPSYVITDIEEIPNLFAYIDNNRPRTAATALQTAGYNGVAPVIAKIIRIGEEIRCGLYNPAGATRMWRFSPIDVLDLVPQYPNAQKAARSAASDWDTAVEFLHGRKDIVAYFAMRVIDLHGEDVADDFFEDLVDGERERTKDDPIGALRTLVEKDGREERPMKKHYMLAALIKVFNAWHKGVPLGRRWMLQVNEDFPQFDEPVAEAA